MEIRERFEWNAETDGPLHRWHRDKQLDGWIWDVHVPTVRTRHGFMYEFQLVETEVLVPAAALDA